MSDTPIGELLAEAGHVNEREAKAIDNPGGRTSRELRSQSRNEAVDGIARELQTAGKLGEIGDGSFSESQTESALAQAELDAADIESADIAAERARELYAAVGGEGGRHGAAKEAIDVYRNRAFELDGGDPSIIPDGGLPGAADPRPSVGPSDFERAKRQELNRAANARRRVQNRAESAIGDRRKGELLERAQTLSAREQAIEQAESADELETATGAVGFSGEAILDAARNDPDLSERIEGTGFLS